MPSISKQLLNIKEKGLLQLLERKSENEVMAADVFVHLLNYISFCGLQWMLCNASYWKTGNNRTGTSTPLILSCKHGQGGPQNQRIFCHSLMFSVSDIHVCFYSPVFSWWAHQTSQLASVNLENAKTWKISWHNSTQFIARVGGSYNIPSWEWFGSSFTFYSYTICIPIFAETFSIYYLFDLYIVRHNNRTCFHIQLQQNLYCPPVPSLCVCLRVSVTEGVAATNTHADMQQLANKDEFCCAWQQFSVHYFPLYPACIPDLSSCLSCKDTLSGPDSSSHAHTTCMAHTHSSCVHAPSHWQFYICREHM